MKITMQSGRRWQGVIATIMLCVLAGAPPAHSQAGTPPVPAPPTGDVGSQIETRASLEAEAKRAEDANRTAEAWLIRARLKQGDFQEGDKILVKLLGTGQLLGRDPSTGDTVTVRAGKMLPLPQMKDLALEGVLRSELQSVLEAHLGRYLRDSSVRVTPLIRLAVFGQVGNPGFHYVPTDILLNDLIMKAGGPAPMADLGNMVIRRGTEVLWSPQDTRTALVDGMSLDRLRLRSGDELYVDDINQTMNWTRFLQYVGPIAGGLWFILNRLVR